ncbi:hypothetical protein [Companilactobacillus kimchiensis]|nr:hypothetical protein [Companilactobacillus kimchiensis]
MQTKHRLELIERECRIRTNLKEIQFTHYFSNRFMEKNTQFFCIEDFFKALGVTSKNALERLPIAIWEQQVKDSTTFSSWQEMLDQAGNEYSLANL